MEKLVYGGDGLGRVEGRVVLAPYVLPGERVRVETIQEKPGLVRGRTLEVLAPSADRVTAPCPYFGRCGGCHYQHALYGTQLVAKRAILEEELRRLGKIEPPGEIEIVSADPWQYRNRIQLHVEGQHLGYRETRSRKLCAITQCPISSPTLNKAITRLNEMVHDRRWPRFLHSFELFTDERQIQFNVLETAQPVARRFFDWCAESLGDMAPGALDYEGRFLVSRSSFFQVNRFLIDLLVAIATRGAEGESALDLYAGVGPFALALGKQFQSVIAVESGSGAVRDLRFNAERAGEANVRAEQNTTEAYLEALDRAPDFVLLDPPRAGLGKAVVSRLVALRPPAITIVACDPATLARDLAPLLASGYQIRQMSLVDLFPQTYHLETVVRLGTSSN